MRQKYEIFSYKQVYLQNYLHVIFYTLFFGAIKYSLEPMCFRFALLAGVQPLAKSLYLCQKVYNCHIFLVLSFFYLILPDFCGKVFHLTLFYDRQTMHTQE